MMRREGGEGGIFADHPCRHRYEELRTGNPRAMPIFAHTKARRARVTRAVALPAHAHTHARTQIGRAHV